MGEAGSRRCRWQKQHQTDARRRFAVRFLLESEAEERAGVAAGSKSTVGVLLARDDDHCIVADCVPGSPAHLSGKLQRGDRITGVDAGGETKAELLARVRGNDVPGSTVTLTVERAGKRRPLEVTLIRGDAKAVAQRRAGFERLAELGALAGADPATVNHPVHHQARTLQHAPRLQAGSRARRARPHGKVCALHLDAQSWALRRAGATLSRRATAKTETERVVRSLCTKRSLTLCAKASASTWRCSPGRRRRRLLAAELAPAPPPARGEPGPLQSGSRDASNVDIFGD